MTARLSGGSVLAYGRGHSPTSSMAFHRVSDLLHHGVHTQPPTDSGSPGCTRCIHSVWVTCCGLSGLRRPVRDHARPCPSVCRFRTRLRFRLGLDEIPQKRDFPSTTLAEGLLRTCPEIWRVVWKEVVLCSRESRARGIGSICRRLAVRGWA